jgi:hypothetical protein
MLDLTELSAWEIHFKSWIRVQRERVEIRSGFRYGSRPRRCQACGREKQLVAFLSFLSAGIDRN